jgi:hypothetical protein
VAYLAAYEDQDFDQFLEKDVAWMLIGPCYFGALRYVDPISLRQRVVPHTSYNSPPLWRAKALRYGADRADEAATRKEGGPQHPWTAHDVAHQRQDAARLRADAEALEAQHAQGTCA